MKCNKDIKLKLRNNSFCFDKMKYIIWYPRYLLSVSRNKYHSDWLKVKQTSFAFVAPYCVLKQRQVRRYPTASSNQYDVLAVHKRVVRRRSGSADPHSRVKRLVASLHFFERHFLMQVVQQIKHVVLVVVCKRQLVELHHLLICVRTRLELACRSSLQPLWASRSGTDCMATTRL